MEEVDLILLHTFQRLGCPISGALDELTTPQIVSCVKCCLKYIKPETEFQDYEEKASMSARFKMCSEIAEAISDLGYPDEIGCQSFLYPSEVETRKLLIFIVEKLPRDIDTITNIGIEQLVSKLSLGKQKQVDAEEQGDNKKVLEMPAAVDVNAFPKETLRFYASHLAELSFSQGRMKYRSENEQKPSPSHAAEVKEDENDDWDSTEPEVVPEKPVTKPVVKPKPDLTEKPKPEIKEKPKIATKPVVTKSKGLTEEEKRQAELDAEINAVHERVAAKAQKVKLQEDALNQLALKLREGDPESLRRELEEKTKALNRFRKTQELIDGSEEGLEKVKNAIDMQIEKLLTLANQWEQHRQPLIDNFRKKRTEAASKLSETTKLKDEIKAYKAQLKQMGQEAKAKQEQYAQLSVELSRMPKDLNRSSYTKRINEIIQNIKKQKREIAKVIVDTKDIQKDINTLSGRLDRTFAVADEMIFKDAEKDKAVAQSYRILVQIHSDFSVIVKSLEEIGNLKRSRRDLEDKLETERGKNSEAKLERLRADLTQMKNENRILQATLNDPTINRPMAVTSEDVND